jgi:hypothetical protein
MATRKSPPKLAAARIADLAQNLSDCTAYDPSWTAESGVGHVDAYGETWHDNVDPEDRYVTFTKVVNDLSVTVALNLSDPGTDTWNRDRAFEGVTVEGHTLFNGRTFTRVGFDVSSCRLSDTSEYPHDYATVKALLDGEWMRCMVAHERTKSAVPVPGLPFTRQPEWFTESGAALRAGKRVTLSPHGMGTGYILSKKRTSPFDRRANQQLEQLLGVTPVYVEPYDHD